MTKRKCWDIIHAESDNDKGERHVSPKEINDRLFPFRKFSLIGEINESLQEHFCGNLEVWSTESDSPVTLLIDSNGGDLFSGRWVADAISFSTVRVNAVVTAVAGSAAFLVLQSCHRRAMYPSAQLMFHYGRISNLNLDICFDPVERVKKALRFIDEQLERLANMSGQSIEIVRLWAHEARKFDAQESLRLKFIDEILEPIPRG